MDKTPEQKWKESIITFRKRCQQILNVSDSIRYVGVINEYGRTLTGMIKPGIKPLLTPERVKNEFFIISTLMSLRNEQAKTIGRLNYVLLEHEKVTLLAFQDKNITYYISIDSKIKEIPKLVPLIKKII